MSFDKTIYEVDEIKTIIDFMRAEKDILDISETSGISTITVSSLNLLDYCKIINLKVGQIVTLNKKNYPVLSVDLNAKSFTIEAIGLYHMSTDLIPVKVLDVVKWNLAINYDYGSDTEINEKLDNAAKDPDKELIRYPLIWLYIDKNNKRKFNFNKKVKFETTLKFGFVHLSEKAYKSEDQLIYVFKPILQPLVDLFLATISSFQFKYIFETDELPIFEDYYRYNFRKTDQESMIMDTPTDAIEISINLSFAKQWIQ